MDLPGIEQLKVVEFLKSKGYTATKEFIENYYKINEGFLKKLLKKDKVIIPGWNDVIDSSDLEIDSTVKNSETVPVPEENLEEEMKIKT